MNEEFRSEAPKTYMRTAIAIAVAMIGGSLVLTFAKGAGMISADWTTRGTMILVGLGIAIYTNLTPKMLRSQARTIAHAVVAQSVARFTGWIMTLAFLAWTAIWVFAPPETANAAAASVVGLSVFVMFCFWLWKSSSVRTGQNH